MRHISQWFSASVLALGSLATYSCQDHEAATVAPVALSASADKQVVSLLAQATTKTASAEEQDKFLAAYRAMSSKQLESFNQLQIAEEAKQHAGQPTVLAELQKTLDLRQRINALAQQLFSKPYNQLTPAQLDQVFAAADNADRPAESAGRGPLTEQVARCDAWFMNRSYKRGSEPKLKYEYLAEVNAYAQGTTPPNPPDCDCRIGFKGTAYSRVVSTNRLSGVLLKAFNNVLGGRVEGGNSYLIVGRQRASLVYTGFSPCASIAEDVRLGLGNNCADCPQ